MKTIQPFEFKQAKLKMNYRSVSPGPQDYNPQRVSRKTPSCKFSKSKRQDLWSVNNLCIQKENVCNYQEIGPGAYNILSQTFSQHPAISFTSANKRFDDSQKKNLPGPGYYKHDSQMVHRTSPSYSLSGKQKNQSINTLTPGPGTYSSENSVLNQSVVGIKFDQAKRDTEKDEKSKSPGPGTVQKIITQDQKQKKQNQNLHTIGLIQQESENIHFFKIKALLKEVFFKKKINDQGILAKQTSAMSFKGFPTGSRSLDRFQSGSPGPDSYFEYSAAMALIKPRYPTIKIGTSPRKDNFFIQKTVPGPTYYNPSFSQLFEKKIPTIIIPKAKIVPTINYNDNPGPGKYNLPSINAGSGFKIFDIKNKTSPRKRDNFINPGPGQYDPRIDISLPTVPKISIPSNQEKTRPPESPAPGFYNILQKITAPSYIMSRGKRSQSEKKRKEISPGPGQYELPSMFIEKTKNIRLRWKREIKNDNESSKYQYHQESEDEF